MVEDIVAEVSAHSESYSVQFHYAHVGDDIYVAILGRNGTLFHCIFRPLYRV